MGERDCNVSLPSSVVLCTSILCGPLYQHPLWSSEPASFVVPYTNILCGPLYQHPLTPLSRQLDSLKPRLRVKGHFLGLCTFLHHSLATLHPVWKGQDRTGLQPTLGWDSLALEIKPAHLRNIKIELGDALENFPKCIIFNHRVGGDWNHGRLPHTLSAWTPSHRGAELTSPGAQPTGRSRRHPQPQCSQNKVFIVFFSPLLPVT